MLSIKDCLDYCDLTEDEVSLLAEHENIPDAAAAQIACGLVQSDQGVSVLTRYLLDMAERASAGGEVEKAQHAVELCNRFMHDHPLPHQPH